MFLSGGEAQAGSPSSSQSQTAWEWERRFPQGPLWEPQDALTWTPSPCQVVVWVSLRN